jgi:DNA mismatch repair protein MutS2
MHKRVFGILEFDKILAMLGEYARSQTGAKACLALKPAEEIGETQRLLSETAEAESIVYRQPSLPVTAFSDIAAELLRLGTGAALNCAEILRLSGVMKAAKRAKEGIFEETSPLLYSYTQDLFYSEALMRDIDRSILSEELVADEASAALRDIRRKILRENESIREKLNAFIREPESAKYLQENIVTLRQGRYVVPVKQEHKGAVKGLVHDQSGSGQTLFIEPMAVVEANNRLRILEAEEKAEIERILRQLSDALRPHAEELGYNIENLTALDVIFAKAMLAKAMKAVAPQISDEGIMELRGGRHPLIDAQKVVPVSVRLGGEYKGLIITGPNTGGKTVTLKLCGLLQLMAQSGLYVPADQGTRLPVYKKIFADIGDEQSIEQSLSTFSSHMRNITGILKFADKRSLVLLDELGAGTDPAEGAALAMSILEELERCRAHVLATTHYSEIKAFAISSPYYENAGMEFDVETLSPTYRLFIGIPGSSNAFRISEKLGLRPAVIERAKQHLSEESIRFEQVITAAEEQREKAEKERGEIEKLKGITLELSERLAQEEKKAAEKKEELLRKAREEALEITKAARQEAEEVIESLKKSAAHTVSEVTRASESARKRLSSGIDTLSEGLKKKRSKAIPKPDELIPGAGVFIVSLQAAGVVIRKPDGRGNVDVQAGVMKLTVKMDDLELVETAQKQAVSSGRVRLAAKPMGMEIDLRGYTVDEAILELDKYLDDAFLYGLSEVSVIHGKGTGALRQGIREFLRHHPHAGAYREGNYGEGDAGITVVSLK